MYILNVTVVEEVSGHLSNEKMKTHVKFDGFHIASVRRGPIDENVLPTLQNLEMTL